MKTPLRSLIAAGLAILAAHTAPAAQQCIVLGDSLTKEYEVEFPVLYPEDRTAWKARNWIETLHQQRAGYFDLGRFTTYPDVRIVGHKHNWAFPGATTQEIRDALLSTSWFNKLWQSELKSQIKGEAERIVIFAGGNDVDDYYDDIYNGASASKFTNRTRDNLIRIVDWVRAVRSNIPIVLVAVPHIGCAPDIQRENPTNGVKTARVSNALAALNSQLATLASQRGVAFAGGVFDLTRNLITQPLVIDGVTIKKGADDDARPQYEFSGDGFHPGTALQAKVAQIIVNTFRARWPSPAIPPLTDAEIRTKVLGL
jgi:lysophospholipase L1-like esterase